VEVEQTRKERYLKKKEEEERLNCFSAGKALWFRYKLLAKSGKWEKKG